MITKRQSDEKAEEDKQSRNGQDFKLKNVIASGTSKSHISGALVFLKHF